MSKFLIFLFVLFSGVSVASHQVQIATSENDIAGCKYLNKVKRSKYIGVNAPEQNLSMLKSRELIFAIQF